MSAWIVRSLRRHPRIARPLRRREVVADPVDSPEAEEEEEPVPVVYRTPAAARAALDSLGIAYTTKAFLTAARAGNLAVVRLFVQGGMSVNATDRYRETALVQAARGGHLEVVRYLVGLGADVNATYDYSYAGETVLHYAAFNGRLAVVQYLGRSGCGRERYEQRWRDGSTLCGAWWSFGDSEVSD